MILPKTDSSFLQFTLDSVLRRVRHFRTKIELLSRLREHNTAEPVRTEQLVARRSEAAVLEITVRVVLELQRLRTQHYWQLMTVQNH